MRRRLERTDHWLAVLERGLTVVCFSALIITIGFNIVARNLLHMSSHELLELAPILVLWISLLGATLAIREQRHIKIELLLRLLPPSWRQAATVANRMFGMLVTAVLAYAAVIFVIQEIQIFGAWGGLSVCFPLFFISVFFRLGMQLIGVQRLPGAAEK